jgi:hypothetical protein
MRTNTFIVRIPMKNIEQVIEVKKTLEQIFGWVVLRGRHSDRKSVLGNKWYKWSQNDIPWRKAEYIDIYLHPKNPNYDSVFKGKGIKRQNMNGINGYFLPQILGKRKEGFYDGWMNEQKSKQSSVYQAIKTLRNHKNSNKPYGTITQQIWQFMNSIGEATFTEMKTFYDVNIRGNATMINGGSFIHHLQSLSKPSKKRGWYLSKQLNNKYALRISK